MNFFFHLSENHPNKICTILLQLKMKISKSIAIEDKVRWLHVYSIVALMSIDSIIEEGTLQTYLVRELTYTFFNLVNEYKDIPILIQITCKLFIKFLRRITPKLGNVTKKFFLVIVSRLKNLALDSEQLSKLCVDMLEFLMIEHKNLFLEEIQKLDSIPEAEAFQKLFAVHHIVKYQNRDVTLKDEILQFLEFGKTVESVSSLKHLRKLLEQSKDDLRLYFTELRQTRGFTEDCKDSHLHKMICTLTTLINSKNKEVSTEAMRCLGAIGPANLATLVLQPENAILNPDKTPLELLIGVAISFFSRYLIDPNVLVQEKTTSALIEIFNTNVGPTLLGLDFGFGTIDTLLLNSCFPKSSQKTFLKATIDITKFMESVNQEILWNPRHNSHEKWITDLVCTFLDNFQEKELFGSFVRICKLKVGEFFVIVFSTSFHKLRFHF